MRNALAGGFDQALESAPDQARLVVRPLEELVESLLRLEPLK